MMHFMVLKVQNLRCFLIELVPMRRKANCWNNKVATLIAFKSQKNQDKQLSEIDKLQKRERERTI
jgi:hypothetical protein